MEMMLSVDEPVIQVDLPKTEEHEILEGFTGVVAKFPPPTEFHSLECAIDIPAYTGRCVIKQHVYGNGRTALVLIDQYGDPLMVATISVPQLKGPNEHTAIKDWGMNKGILSELIRLGVIYTPTAQVAVGDEKAHIVKLCPPWNQLPPL